MEIFCLRGMLKKATSGVLAILSCSRTGSTLRASKIAAALLDDFFDHSRRLPVLKFSRAHPGFFARNIQQAPKENMGSCDYGKVAS